MDDAALEAAGWERMPANAFTTHIGPFWARGGLPELDVAFVGQPHHANHISTVNGGMLATFADVALGYATVLTLGAANCATAQLQMHYTSTAKIGELVTCRPEVIRRSSTLVFLRGLIRVGEKTVATVDGIWAILTPRS